VVCREDEGKRARGKEKEGWRERGKEGKRERGKEGKRERGKEGKRERGKGKEGKRARSHLSVLLWYLRPPISQQLKIFTLSTKDGSGTGSGGQSGTSHTKSKNKQ
jgi:hypothetical protein